MLKPESAPSAPKPRKDIDKRQTLNEFLHAVWLGDIAGIRGALLSKRHSQSYRDTVDSVTGMNGLHIAVGRNNLEMTKLLVEAGAKFIPDAQGRMPSVIAAEMEVDEELQDYIVEAEAKAVGEGV